METADSPRILVVDDELSVCKSCEKILVGEGYRVKSILFGSQALGLLDQEPFDIVFTDLKMAEMGGDGPPGKPARPLS